MAKHAAPDDGRTQKSTQPDDYKPRYGAAGSDVPARGEGVTVDDHAQRPR